MVRYLSAEWLAAADAAVAGLAPAPSALSVAHVVTGGPGGDRRYRVVYGPDRVRVLADDGGPCDVTLVQSWETARAVARGERSAQRAFLDGDIRVEGDVRAVLAVRAFSAALDDPLGPLRERTEFD